MAIDITNVGAAASSGDGSGVVGHTFKKVNVNTEDNYIYANIEGNETLPSLSNGVSYIYSDGVGAVGGLTTGDLVYARVESESILKFSSTSDGDFIN